MNRLTGEQALLNLQEALRAIRQDVDEDLFRALNDLYEAVEDVLVVNGLDVPDFLTECPDCGGQGVGCCVNADLSREWCLHCGADDCRHATKHNQTYGRLA